MRQKIGLRWGAGLFLAVLFGILLCTPVMADTKLGETEEAYWDGDHMGVARWKKVENAKEYQVRLYEGGEIHVKTVTVSGTRVDLSSYMNDGCWYHFTVRAVPKSSQKKVSSGEWVESDQIQAEGLGDTTGKWRTDSQGKKYQKEDGDYVTEQWYLIHGQWYYFDQEGHMATGWQQVGEKTYYLNEEGIMQTGWMDNGGDWYYLDADGSMAVGWREYRPGEWYYLGADGKMLTNTVIDGWQLDASGKRVQ